MRFVVLVIGALWLAVGITVVYAPGSVPEWLAIETIGPWIRHLAIIPLVIGVLLILASGRLRLTLYLRIIGVLSVLKGLFFLFSPPEYVRSLIGWYISFPIWFMRVSGSLSIALALIVVIVAIISLFEEDII